MRSTHPISMSALLSSQSGRSSAHRLLPRLVLHLRAKTTSASGRKRTQQWFSSEALGYGNDCVIRIPQLQAGRGRWKLHPRCETSSPTTIGDTLKVLTHNRNFVETARNLNSAKDADMLASIIDDCHQYVSYLQSAEEATRESRNESKQLKKLWLRIRGQINSTARTREDLESRFRILRLRPPPPSKPIQPLYYRTTIHWSGMGLSSR